MKHRLAFIICSFSSIAYGMQLDTTKPTSNGVYTDVFEEGKEVIICFFSKQNSFSLRDSEVEPEELLESLLRDPKTEQMAGLPFEEFKQFYEGIQAGLTSLKENQIMEEKADLVDELLENCTLILSALSYQELYRLINTSQWMQTFASIITLFSTLTVFTQPPRPPLNFASIKEGISQDTIPGTYDIIWTLENHIGDGNITSKDINELSLFAGKLLNIKMTQKDFKTTKEYANYLTSLKDLGKKILILNQSPCTLYEGTHEQCFYDNGVPFAVHSFKECISTTNGLASGRCITQADIEDLDYLESFIEGIHIGLQFHPDTFGRKSALKKLTAFIEQLQPFLASEDEADMCSLPQKDPRIKISVQKTSINLRGFDIRLLEAKTNL